MREPSRVAQPKARAVGQQLGRQRHLDHRTDPVTRGEAGDIKGSAGVREPAHRSRVDHAVGIGNELFDASGTHPSTALRPIAVLIEEASARARARSRSAARSFSTPLLTNA